MLERIKASTPARPPAEQRVARLLMADPRGFATLPVSELAERSHVSKPTVVRFCRSIGYDGLADFKLKLAEGTLLTVLDDAPVEAGGFIWRKVREVGGEEGWAAEDYLTIRAPCGSD